MAFPTITLITASIFLALLYAGCSVVCPSCAPLETFAAFSGITVNHYEVLGVSRNADVAEIQQVFAASSQSPAARRAFSILSDSDLRLALDRTLDEEESTRAARYNLAASFFGGLLVLFAISAGVELAQKRGQSDLRKVEAERLRRFRMEQEELHKQVFAARQKSEQEKLRAEEEAQSRRLEQQRRMQEVLAATEANKDFVATGLQKAREEDRKLLEQQAAEYTRRKEEEAEAERLAKEAAVQEKKSKVKEVSKNSAEAMIAARVRQQESIAQLRGSGEERAMEERKAQADRERRKQANAAKTIPGVAAHAMDSLA